MQIKRRAYNFFPPLSILAVNNALDELVCLSSGIYWLFVLSRLSKPAVASQNLVFISMLPSSKKIVFSLSFTAESAWTG